MSLKAEKKTLEGDRPLETERGSDPTVSPTSAHERRWPRSTRRRGDPTRPWLSGSPAFPFHSGGPRPTEEGHGPRSHRGEPHSTPGPRPWGSRATGQAGLVPAPQGCGGGEAHTVPEGAGWAPQGPLHASVRHLPPGRPPGSRDTPPPSQRHDNTLSILRFEAAGTLIQACRTSLPKNGPDLSRRLLTRLHSP